MFQKESISWRNVQKNSWRKIPDRIPRRIFEGFLKEKEIPAEIRVEVHDEIHGELKIENSREYLKGPREYS